MKSQALTLIVVFSGIVSSASLEAGDFSFGDAFRTVQKIQRGANGNHSSGGKTWHGGGNPGQVKTLPHPGYGKPATGPFPVQPTPVHKPICKPQPPFCKPHPPVCVEPPISHCPPPINRPPVRCLVMTLINHAGAEVYFNLNENDEYTQMPIDDTRLIKSHSSQPHRIQYHNGLEVVEFELNPSATYVFEWQGETLALLEVQV